MQIPAGRSAKGRVTEMFGRYRLLGRLAVGGMAEVWAAQLLAAGGFCKAMVIKRVLPELAQNPTFLRMLMNEAKVAARFSHTNVCAVFELGEVEGEYYIAMEYLRGAALTQVLRAGGAVPAPAAVSIIAQACDGLHYAHEQRDGSGNVLGLVHRDVSPHNLFVTVDGVVKVLDFGIAKVDDGSNDRTEAGKVKGKLPYMSPEQLAAQPLDRRSDVWSLGVVLWELLAGKRLFGGASPAFTVDAIRNARIPSLASVGVTEPGLDDVLAKAMCRSREFRYATAAELRTAMVAALGAPPAQAPVLSELVWARGGTQIQAHDKMFEDDDGAAEEDPGVVERLPLRADATQPSYEHVDLLVLGTTAISGVLDSFDHSTPRPRTASPTAETRATNDTVPEVRIAEPSQVVLPGTDPEIAIVEPAPRRMGWLVAVLALLVVAGVAALLMKDSGSKSAAAITEPEPEAEPVAVADPAPIRIDPAPIRIDPAPIRIDPAPEPAPAPVLVPDPVPVDVADPVPTPTPKPTPKPTPRPRPVAPKVTAPAPKVVAAKPGKLTIDAKPWAKIYVDGKSYGATPIVGASVPAGDHTVKAVAEDGTTRTIKIHVEPGGEVRKRVNW